MYLRQILMQPLLIVKEQLDSSSKEEEKILQALAYVQEALGSCLDVATMLTFIRLMPAVVTCISYTN